MEISIKMERFLALLFCYASNGSENWVVAVAFAGPEKKEAFKIVDLDRLDELFKSDSGIDPERISALILNLNWFWMRPFDPENIKLDLKEALCSALTELKIEDEKSLIEMKKETEEITRKNIVKTLGKKSVARVKIKICSDISLSQRQPEVRAA
ncbi:MAG: hypothetical protein WC949_03455 [Candidatus Paceibacterota bacterium]|jgi:hypothetical protein